MAILRLAFACAPGGESGGLFAAGVERIDQREEALPAEPDRGGSPGSPSRREERRLVRAAQRGSGAALDELFRRHWPRAYRSAFMVVRDPSAAEDVAQEAFIAAIRALDRFDRRRPFAPWLQRIAINKAIDHARARALRAEAADGAAGEFVVGTPGAGDPDPDPRAEGLEAALDSLSAEHRAIVAMRYVLDLTPGEIARELRLPRGTVNSRLRRALDQLADRLGGEQ